jgi:hypothetical protein
LCRAIVVTSALAVKASPAFANQEGKTKTESTEKTATKETPVVNLASCRQVYRSTPRKRTNFHPGSKRKDEDGQPTKGLVKGGKKLDETRKKNKPFK